MVSCPVECMSTIGDVVQGPQASFIEKNSAFLLTVLGMVGGVVASMLTFCVKSRCTTIRCWGMECVRDVIKLDTADVKIEMPTNTGPVNTSSNA